MSLRTEYLGEELGGLYELSAEREPQIREAWTIVDVLELIGFSDKEGNFTLISDGSYGYYVLLCTDLDYSIERCLQKLEFEQQDYEDLWVRKIGGDQLTHVRMAGIFNILIKDMISCIGYSYYRIHQLSISVENDLPTPPPPLTSYAYKFIPDLTRSSIENRKPDEFLGVLYKGFCEPFRNSKIGGTACNSLIGDISWLRHHFSGHDLEIPGDPEKLPRGKIKKAEKILNVYAINRSLTHEIDVIIFKYNLLKSVAACLTDICDELGKIPLE